MAPAAHSARAQLRRWERIWLGAGAAILVALAFSFYRHERALVLDRAQSQLATIGELMARRIYSRLSLHARHIEGTANLLGVDKLLSRGGQRFGPNLEAWRREEELLGVAIFGDDGRQLVSVGIVPSEGAELSRLLAESRVAGQSVWSEVSRAPVLQDSLVLTVAAPMSAPAGPGARIVGYVIATYNASRDIADVLDWRYRSGTAQFVLVRQAGSEILFLAVSDAGGQKPPRQLSASTPRLAVALAFASESSAIEALDYTGHKVVFASASVPGTTWKLVSKLDFAEALRPARDAAWMSLALVLLVAGGLVHFGILDRRRAAAENHAWDVSKALELEISRRRFDLLSRAVNECVLLLDRQGLILDVNERCVDMYGWQREELLGKPATILRPLGGERECAERLDQVFRDGSAVFEADLRRKDGSPIAVEVSARAAEWDNLPIAQHVHADISERRREALVARATQEKQRLASSIFGSSSEAMVITGPDNLILEVNPAFTRITGYAAEDVVGQDPKMLSSGRQTAEFYAELWHVLSETGHWEGEIWNRRKSGEIFAEWLVITTIRDEEGAVRNYVAQFSDITERKQAGEIIWRHANFDGLTGLPNRRLFHDRLEQDVKRFRRADHGLAVLFVDLDRFKEVNDVLGHLVGDQLLVQAAQRLLAGVRESDTVARLGGDEFTVILNDVPDAAIVTRIVDSMLASLNKPYEIGTERVHLSASIGIAICPQDGADADTILQNSDQAMYRAKKSGRNRYSFFTPAMHEETQRHHRLGQDLHEALGRKEFEVHYQPIVDLPTGEIREAEALIRWNHPTLGMISPGVFIPIAEEVGLIRDIGDWVFESAVQKARQWEALAVPGFRIAVNISPAQLMHRNGSVPLMAQLREAGGNGSQIILEITEGLLLSDRPDIAKALEVYRRAGMKIAIDDFGTGYSSLSYLAKFRLDYVKIDRAFISQLHAGSSSLSLSEAIIVMAHKLGLRVIAEGIETAEQRDLLIAAGCDYGQGYLYSKPVPADEFEKMLAPRDGRGSGREEALHSGTRFHPGLVPMP